MKTLITNLLADFFNKKHHFLITSHGQTASMWLAAVLNLIPEIFCSHGYMYPPQPASLTELSEQEFSLRVASFKRFETLTLDDLFSELKSITNKPIIGNILAFYFGRLVDRDPNFKIKASIVNMVRHPITRITSTLFTWTNPEHDRIPSFVEVDFQNRCTHFIDFLADNHSADFSKNINKAFVVALLAIEDITRDVSLAKFHGVQNVRYEDITSKRGALKDLVMQITADKVKLSDDLLDKVFLSKKINAHNATGIEEENKQYQSWDKWQQDLFKFVMERNHFFHVYDQLNYNFSFVS